MPKANSKQKKRRHDPLHKQILADQNNGILRPIKPEKEDGVQVEEVVPAKITQKIMQQAQAQREEELAHTRGPSRPTKSEVRLAGPAGDDSDQEQEELLHMTEVFEEVEISAEDEAALAMFMPDAQPVRRTLADVIMEKIREKEQGFEDADMEKALKAKLEPQVVACYTEVGKFMSHYTSGKVPKAFKIIPTLRNWEDVLVITDIEHWSPQAMFVATRLFASNLNPKMAQRFYNLVLLPRIRRDIDTHRRLNYHLYMSIKKAIYKPAAFFRGLLLPLAEDCCSVRESIIVCSVLTKCSIPAIHSAVALLKLAQMEYSGPIVLIMRTLLNKKYSLPYKVIDTLVRYFCRFEEDERDMPVVFHQNLLTFVQRYKNELTPKQKAAIKALTRQQQHRIISSEVRRELNAVAPLNLLTGQAGGRTAMDLT